jgi:hypothetical protein
VLLFRENRDLQRRLTAAEIEVVRAGERAERASADSEIAAADLVSANAELKRLTAEAAEATATPQPMAWQAMPARAYLGEQCVGTAWVLPPRGADGKRSAAPVVVLDASVGMALSARRGAATGEGATASAVSYAYVNPPNGYNGWWGGWPLWGPSWNQVTNPPTGLRRFPSGNTTAPLWTPTPLSNTRASMSDTQAVLPPPAVGRRAEPPVIRPAPAKPPVAVPSASGRLDSRPLPIGR